MSKFKTSYQRICAGITLSYSTVTNLLLILKHFYIHSVQQICNATEKKISNDIKNADLSQRKMVK